MNFGMLGDPITPVINAVTGLARRWPAITSIALVNYGGSSILEMVPSDGSYISQFIQQGTLAAVDIVRLSAWDNVKGAMP